MTSLVQPSAVQATPPITGKAPVANAADPGAEKAPKKEFSSFLDADTETEAQQAEANDAIAQIEQPANEEESTEAEDTVDLTEETVGAEGPVPDALTRTDAERGTSSSETTRQAMQADDTMSAPLPKSADNTDVTQMTGVKRDPAMGGLPSAAQVPLGQNPDTDVQIRVSSQQGNETGASSRSAAPAEAIFEAKREGLPIESPRTSVSSEPTRVLPTPLDQATARSTVPVSPPIHSDTLSKNGLINRRDVELSLGQSAPAPGNLEARASPSLNRNAGISQTLVASGANLAVPAERAIMDPNLRIEFAGSFADPAEVDMASRSDLQNVSRLSTTGFTASLELPRYIAQQLSAAFSVSGGKTTEIALNPAELGRVRISLNSAESGLVVSIIAERPETLDLVRRNVVQLAAEFTDIGYGNVEFNFGQGASDQAGTQSGDPQDEISTVAAGAINDDPQKLHTTSPASVLTPDRVDIRL